MYQPIENYGVVGNMRTAALVGKNGSIDWLCFPHFDSPSVFATLLDEKKGVCFHSPKQSLGVATDVKFERKENGVVGRFTLKEGQSSVFVLQGVEQGRGCGLPISEEQAVEHFKETVTYWRPRCTYTVRWREMVHRSALVLKLLTFEPTGAIVAAPTCSLPEALGGQRNWDYRYVWIRDAAFTVYALMRIGFQDEAARSDDAQYD